MTDTLVYFKWKNNVLHDKANQRKWIFGYAERSSIGVGFILAYSPQQGYVTIAENQLTEITKEDYDNRLKKWLKSQEKKK